MALILDTQTRITYEQTRARNVTKTTTYSMDFRDLIVNASILGGSWTLKLPRVSDSRGLDYLIRLTVGAAAGTAPNVLTITDRGDSINWQQNYRMNRAGQWIRFYCTGEEWKITDHCLGYPNLPKRYIHEMWTRPFILGAAGGGPPSVTLENIMMCADGNIFSYIPLVGQTLHPSWSNPGLNIAGDQVDADGWEFTTGIGAGNPNQFVVGTDPGFFVRLRASIADVSGLNNFALGFRKREAYQADMDDYDELACLNSKRGAVNIETILNTAAVVVTDTTDTWADTATHTFEVKVSSAGVVTYLYDGVAPTVVAAYTFDAAEILIPFLYVSQHADFGGANVLLEFECGLQP